MATEYRLSYTAQEIDERLRKTDELENKQDKLTFDSVPTEGSENLVKSGDIYTAIQNATPNLTFDEAPTEGSENLVTSGVIHTALQNVGGGESLTAGDLLEIKDGVIRSTLGDSLGTETKSEIFYDSGRLVLEDSYISENDVEDGKTWAEYYYPTVLQPTFLDKPENEGEFIELDVKYYPPNSDEFVVLKSMMMYEYDTKDEVDRYEVHVNTKLGEDDLEIDNANYPVFNIQANSPYWDDDKEEYIYDTFGIYASTFGYGVQDVSGARFVIDKEEIIEKFVTLPDNALIAGDFIEIKDGVVSSTLGKTYTEVEQVTFFDSDILELEDSYVDEEDPSYAEYYYGTIYQKDFLDTTEDEIVELDVKYYPPESDEFIILKGLYESGYDSKDEEYYYDVYINAKFGEDELEIDNSDYPIITLHARSPYLDEYDEYINEFEINTMSMGQDISGSRIVIDGERVTSTTVKLPKAALDLTVDDEVEEDSYNPVSSDAVYRCMRDLEWKIDNNQVNLTFDSTPTSGSSNPVTSNGIYDAIKEVEQASKLLHKLSPYLSDMYLSVSITSDNKSTTTDARINMRFYNEYQKRMIRMMSCGLHVSIIFSDEPDKIYYIERVSDIYNVDDNSCYFKFDFEKNTDTFPIDTNIASRTIKHLMVHYDDNLDSHAEGYLTTAIGSSSHAEGRHTVASGEQSHAEGYYTVASGDYSHAEGRHTVANGNLSHVQGRYNIADTEHKHVHIVGNGTSSNSRSNAHTLDWDGNAWFAGDIYVGGTSQEDSLAKRVVTEDGVSKIVKDVMIGKAGDADGAEIFNSYADNTATGVNSHAEGGGTTASGNCSHAEGQISNASGNCSHAEGLSTTASGEQSHAEGLSTTASGNCSHAEGQASNASGDYSHVQGYYTTASGDYSHAEGWFTTASGDYSHVQGKNNIEDTEGKYAHIVGNGRGNGSNQRSNAHTLDWDGNAWFKGSIYVGGTGQDDENAKLVITEDTTIGKAGDAGGAEIFNSYADNTATGANSHAEGYRTTASGIGSHAEGYNTIASDIHSHAEGTSTTASGYSSHAEGLETVVSGYSSHAEGRGTVASGDYSHVQGRYNIEDTEDKYAHIVGNGNGVNQRSNAHTLDWDGNAWFAGAVEATAIILKSSTNGSTKRFKVTVDDSGTLSATEIVETETV